ncbi:hypothetical protein KI387_043635, partial [Taxus chinensis]
KQRPINPRIEPLMRKELSKLIESGIIFPVKHSSWVANLVPVRKKNGEIRLCVDFRDLNKASLKDHYPLPNMDQILRTVSGSDRLSLLDGYSGYNQILVRGEDRYKTTFTTKWGTYAYKRMPFGLSNAGATFQRAMDMAFRSLLNKCILVYLDDVTVFSKNSDEHLMHLRQTFQICRQFGISLNPKKSIFSVHEGKLLGHIVSKQGLAIDPFRIEAISQLSLPHHKKALQSFLGKINFVRRFVPDFAALVKPLTAMLRKEKTFSWTSEGREGFEAIKTAISQAPTLANPNFDKDFTMYALAGAETISAILTQVNDENIEQPIAFFGQSLHDYETRYTFLEKQVLSIVRGLKNFKYMLSNNRIHVLVSHPNVKAFLLNKELNEKRAGWITKVMEYDVDIRVAKIVRGKGLCEHLITDMLKNQAAEPKDSEQHAETTYQQSNVMLQPGNQQPELPQEIQESRWMTDLVNYLQHGTYPE